jgi:hypothetical protein
MTPDVGVRRVAKRSFATVDYGYDFPLANAGEIGMLISSGSGPFGAENRSLIGQKATVSDRFGGS